MTNKPCNAMTLEELEAALKKLRLSNMAAALKEVAEAPQYQDMSFEKRLGILVYRELETRRSKRADRCLQRSGLKALEPFNQADWDKVIREKGRKLDTELIQRLLSCQWIKEGGHNLLIEGPTGTGKTWILALLGKIACEQGLSVMYVRCNRLVELIEDALKHSETATLRNKLNSNQLLIIDDFVADPFKPEITATLLAILDERIGNSSVAIASQVAFEEWHTALGSNHNAEAIIDRLFNDGYKIELSGRSLRERRKLK